MTTELEICKLCGWHIVEPHHCDPDRGRHARALAERVSDVPSSQLGYGDGRLTFEFDEDFKVVFNVGRNNTFSIRYFFLNEQIPAGHAAELIRQLRMWRGHGKEASDILDGAPIRDIVFGEEVKNKPGYFLVTLSCGHTKLVNIKKHSYACRECAPPADTPSEH
jgi:hypothetical protein